MPITDRKTYFSLNQSLTGAEDISDNVLDLGKNTNYQSSSNSSNLVKVRFDGEAEVEVVLEGSDDGTSFTDTGVFKNFKPNKEERFVLPLSLSRFVRLKYKATSLLNMKVTARLGA